MGFTPKAIKALSERRIKPYIKIETKLSTENPLDPWHNITFRDGKLIHDANEFCSELRFKAIDPSGLAIDPFRDDAGDTNYLRTGSRIRLLLGITYIGQSGETTEYRQAFKGFITGITPFVDEGFWGLEVVAHDDFIRARNAVAAMNRCAGIIRIEETLITSDYFRYYGTHENWIAGMVTVKRTLGGQTRIVTPDEYQVLEKSGGIEFFDEQSHEAVIEAEYFYYDGDDLHVSEVIRLALEYSSENGGTGLDAIDYDLVDTSQNNPDPDKRLPLIRFTWDEIDGGPIEIYNYLLNKGLIPENLKFWFDSEVSKWKLQFIYQKDEDNPETPGFEPDFEVVRSIAFDDPADSEELYTRVIVTGRRHAPRNLAKEGSINTYALPPHPGYNASFSAPSEIEGASNMPENLIDGSVNTQYMWILGEKVGEDTADGAIIEGTEDSAMPEFDPEHPYNEIAPLYIDLGELISPSRVAINIGSNRFGTDRNPGRPQMLVSIQVVSTLTNPLDMHDPNWVPLSEKAYKIFSNANELIDLTRDDFLFEQFRYIRLLFHFGLFYKWKPERRYIEYPIREISVFEDEKLSGIDQVSETRYPGLYARYQKRGYRTYMHEDFSLQTQDEVDHRASKLLDELVRSYLDRESSIAWDPRFRLHAPSTVSGLTVHGLTISEKDPRYNTTDSRLVTRIEYDLEDFIVRVSGTDYFREVE